MEDKSLNYLQLDFNKTINIFNDYIISDYLMDLHLLSNISISIFNIFNGSDNILMAKKEYYNSLDMLYVFCKKYNFYIDPNILDDNTDDTFNKLEAIEPIIYKILFDISNIINNIDNDNIDTLKFIYGRDIYRIANILEIIA